MFWRCGSRAGSWYAFTRLTPKKTKRPLPAAAKKPRRLKFNSCWFTKHLLWRCRRRPEWRPQCARARRSSIVNAQEGVTSYSYYSNNLKQAAIDALGNTTSYSYDNNGNLLTSTDANQKTSAFTYDTNNDLLSVTDPLSHQTTFAYDPKGNLLTTLDAAGDVITNTYNSSGLLLT